MMMKFLITRLVYFGAIAIESSIPESMHPLTKLLAPLPLIIAQKSQRKENGKVIAEMNQVNTARTNERTQIRHKAKVDFVDRFPGRWWNSLQVIMFNMQHVNIYIYNILLRPGY